jgi:uncharacterized membrane protein YsdA (DUF1294 family)
MPDLWTSIAVLYLAMSLVTFGAYGLDKRRARRGDSRTPERRLHLLELLGGWPGALLGMKVFRHKTQKRSFRLVFFAVVLLHLGAWAAWGWYALGGGA